MLIGTTFIRSSRISIQLAATVIGAIFYRFVLTFALQIGLPSGDLKILSAAIVIAAIASANLSRRKKKNA